MKEVWKDIMGYENYYQVSNMGAVRSKDRELKSGIGKFVKRGRTLKAQPNANGYLRINLKIPNKRKYVFVHRLVAVAFVPNPSNKPCVNHVDSNFLNNRADNLEWVTQKENMRHAIKKGRFDESFANTLNKFAKDRESKQRAVIGTNVKTGEKIIFSTIQEAGRYFNGRAGDICKCCKGERQTAQGYRWEYVK